MLGVGIDWAETFHVVALGRPGDGVVQVLRVEHSKPALEALLEQLRALEPDPGEVRVVLETRHGLLVERLLEAGFVVVPVNPDLIARRRGPAKKRTTSRTPASPACWPWIASSRCDLLSPTASSPPSCVRWAATTNAPARMNAAC